MDMAYADPPYFGRGVKDYGSLHPDAGHWDQKSAHLNLIDEMCKQFDGWAMSCNPADLSWILCRNDIRVCAWTKTFHQIRPLVSVQYSWEPVLLWGGRKIAKRAPMVRDWHAGCVAMRKGLKGAKPDDFYVWVLDLLGFDPREDTMIDLFPGTGGLGNVVSVYEAPWLVD